jgi:hypothetical protein
MRFFLHTLLEQVYLSWEDELPWKRGRSGGAPTRSRSLDLYTRLAPDQGRPENECGLVSVQEDLFQRYLREIDQAEALRRDRRLVEFLGRWRRCPGLPVLLKLLPRGARLQLIACEWTSEGTCFDVYLADSPRLVYLNPLLLALFPWREIDGVKRLLMPFTGATRRVGDLLMWALEARLWGAEEEVPVYTYDLEY